MIHQVSIETVDAQAIAVVRRPATWSTLPQVITPGMADVWAHLRANPPAATGRNVIIYLDNAPMLLIGAEVQPPLIAGNSVYLASTPSGLVATTLHRGPYADLPAAHKAIRDHCIKERRARAGPCWEVYGHWSDDPAQLCTEIFYLLRVES